MSFPDQSSVRNLLLHHMSAADFALLQPHLHPERFELGAMIFEANTRHENVHFIESGTASIVDAQERGDTVEIGLYSYEGMSGGSVVLGAGQSPHRSMVQEGNATSLRIASGQLLEACRASSSLQDLLLRYVHTLSIQVASTAASNAQLALPERLARWLLMCHDRAEGDQLVLTHEFMSTMLAVRRSGVTVTLHSLEATGAIRGTRGIVQVVDRPRLEEIAGSSYGLPEQEYGRLIGAFGKGRPQLSLVE
ncbi:MULTISPECIES: Crp/Fnr family transcriptional regulator [unclassified Sphingomonas]|uniref:Crp/Fnr family transcriptional regulator n=1 Tax=unclassified Sphingomonas TaxID=196159 RepID=UPI00226A360E|nr:MULTISPECIES: Crp/Fnr family transcriptional regulator [unclassified Sphingomonas]